MTRPATSRFVVRVAPRVCGPAELAMLDSALAAASGRLRGAGVVVRLLQTVAGGDDRSSVVCIFEAESAAAVRRALDTAQVPTSRIELAADRSRLPARSHRYGRQASSTVLGSMRHGAFGGGGAPSP